MSIILPETFQSATAAIDFCDNMPAGVKISIWEDANHIYVDLLGNDYPKGANVVYEGPCDSAHLTPMDKWIMYS